jgi:rhodanese-related sulfurtransferase
MSMVLVVVIAIVVIWAVWYSMAQSNKGSQQTQGKQSTSPRRISPQEYQTNYAKRDHLLVDVRTAEEYGTGHIPGAVNIALQSLPDQMATLSKEQPIILYCRSGARSSNAAAILQKAGFDKVYDLGAITQWQAQGLPVQ